MGRLSMEDYRQWAEEDLDEPIAEFLLHENATVTPVEGPIVKQLRTQLEEEKRRRMEDGENYRKMIADIQGELQTCACGSLQPMLTRTSSLKAAQEEIVAQAALNSTVEDLRWDISMSPNGMT